LVKWDGPEKRNKVRKGKLSEFLQKILSRFSAVSPYGFKTLFCLSLPGR